MRKGLVELLKYIAPFLLTLLIYSNLGLVLPLFRGEIHTGDLYLLEKAWFGLPGDSGTMTPNEWLEAHTHPLLDLLTGAVYLAYIPHYLIAVALMRWLLPAPRDRRVSLPMAWNFLIMNVAGYVGYFLFPAAPPWFVETFGMGAPPVGVEASPARAIRFDEITGTTLMSDFYAQASNVFGAIPSLHAAYPVAALYFAVKAGKLRLYTGIYAALMAFSAVYLNHHYVIDVLAGWAVGLATAFVVHRLGDSVLRERKRISGAMGSSTASRP